MEMVENKEKMIGVLPPDKEAEKADTLCATSHSLELSKDIQVVQKFLLQLK